jgi:hypothetical protein
MADDNAKPDAENGIPKEEAVDTNAAAIGPASSRRRIWMTIGIVTLVCLVVFAITFPIVYLEKKDDDDDSQSKDEESLANGSNSNGNGQAATAIKEFVSDESSPFEVRLAMFDKSVADGYKGNTTKLQEDLQNVAKFLLNNVIYRNTGKVGYAGVGLGQQNPNYFLFRGPVMEFAPAPEADGTAADVAEAPAAPPVAAEGGSVGDDVDDYGTNNQEEGVEEGDMLVSDGENVFAAYGDKIVVWNATSGELQLTLKVPAAPEEDVVTTGRSLPYPGYWGPSVRHLLLHEDRLMVIVEGYQSSIKKTVTRDFPILYEFMSTHIRLYKIVGKDAGLLQLVSTADINGRFDAARSIDGKVHVVTTSGIDTYTDLIAPFESYNYQGLSEEDYIAEVVRTAEEKAIPNFVEDLLAELNAGPSFPDLFRISLLQSEASGSQNEALTFDQGVVNSLTQVHSFDLSSDSETIDFSVSGSFLPTWTSHVYGATGTLIICGEGWEYDHEKHTSTQSTHFMGIEIDGATSRPHSVGKVAGYILNSRSVDVKDNILRVATTIRRSWFFPFPDPLPVDVEVADTEDTATTAEIAEEESSTQNFVITLDMTPSDGIMEELGRIKLGKPNEVFTAVRFFDNVAYAVTFERRDPLYVLDLSDPANPTKLSELDISGFSSYLHSINDDNTLILAIGEEADDDGIILGMQITIFDLRDPDNPEVAQRLVVEKDPNTWSSSDSLWDFLSVRYAAGRLMIPMNINSWENEDLNFNGFVVYVANENELFEECRISHDIENPQEGDTYCFGCNSWLPRRSMVFRGDLMTTDSHFVRYTDLDTCDRLWTLDLVEDNSDDSCCYFY